MNAGAHFAGGGLSGVSDCGANLSLNVFSRSKKGNKVLGTCAFTHFSTGVGGGKQLGSVAVQDFWQLKVLLSYLMVKSLGDVAGQFEMLILVASNGHKIGLVHQNVSSLKDGVGEEAGGNVIVFGLDLAALIFELGHASELTIRAKAMENPVEFSMLRYKRLNEKRFFTDACRQQIQHHIPGVFL